MSAPLSYSRFIQALKGEGLRVVEVKTEGKSPASHNRNSAGRWGGVNGVMIHHTVTKGTQHTVDLCRRGYEGLPGPLCHGVIAKDGTVYIVGYGRANHAGKGDRDVLNAVIRESYATNPPAPNRNEVDGNPHFYGFECENLGDGKDGWPDAQLEAIERVGAALCRAHGWTEKSVIGHLEWQAGKVDPRGFTMASMRTRTRRRLAGSNTPPKPKPPAPKPKPPTETKDQEQDRRIAALEQKVAALEKG